MNQMKPIFLTIAIWLGFAASADEAVNDEQSSEIEEIVVSAHPLASDGLAQASDVLTGNELESKMVDNIGATVGNEPGVHNSAYGVGAGRPVIHGLGGPRVRVMEERVDTLDVSVNSGDHAVAIDPFLAKSIEILKGSSTLLYGSGAIGGVVNVQTDRIPQEVPERLQGSFSIRGSNNGSGKNGSFRLDGGGGNIGWHIDAFSRDSDDYEIPGYAESALLRALEEEEEHHEDDHDDEADDHDEEEHHEDEHEDEHEEVFGVLTGSAVDVRGGSVGASAIGESGFIGFSVSNLDSSYGIPGHSHAHGHHEDEHHDEDEHDDDHAEDEHDDEEHHGEEDEVPPIVELEQTRIDFEAGLENPFSGFDNLNLRLGINDYEHSESEGEEVGVLFSNEAWEGRAELTHGSDLGWRGAFGVQLGNREFSATGEGASTPLIETSSSGLFWVGERSLGESTLETGVRFDRVSHDPSQGQSRSFNGLSASLGFVIPLSDVWQGSLLADLSSRAPVGEELFLDNPHPGLGVFEVGDLDLDNERARNLSSTLIGAGDNWTLSGTFYYTSFSGFIYQAATGEEHDGFDVYQYSQSDATFPGFEIEGSVTVAEWAEGQLELGAFFDTVSPSIDVSGNDNLPLIPPDRLGLSMEITNNRLLVSLDLVRASEQNDVGSLELPSESYTDLRARIAWRFRFDDRTLDLFLAGRNLTDDEQRLHTSVVKDRVPQPGRSIETGLRMRF